MTTPSDTASSAPEVWKPEPGVYHEVSERRYHSSPYVSKSKLWRLHKVMDLEYDPERLKALVLSDRPETGALAMGRLVDDLLFAGRDEAMQRYCVGPTKTRDTKKWRESEAELPEGVSFVTQDEVDRATAMADSIARHPVASELLMQGCGHKQLSVIADDPKTGLRCKGRIDRLTSYQGETAHVDLKTCRDVERFRFDAEDYGYWIQASHYLDLCQRIDEMHGREPRNRRFIFVAVQKTPSTEAPGYHRIRCYEYDLQSLESALRMRDTLLEQWRILFEENRHPGERPRINPIFISERAEQKLEPQT